MFESEKICNICGNKIDKVNRWKICKVIVHDYMTGEDEELYLCDRCFKSKIGKYVKIK